jgi:tRNA A-37 threonylcarbamoyl transferase component Bud32
MNETVKTCPQCGAAIPPDAPQGLCPKCVLAAAAHAPHTTAPASSAPQPPALAKMAAAFPQLEIIELIGAGGMGAVFKARQPKLERFVALKILPEALSADPGFAERFSREARVLASLNHPNIVTVYDVGQAGGFLYLLMEYVDGVNLREAMAAGRFTPTQALALVPKICEALQYAHNEGVLHRDIKPENILLDVKGRLKIADFGIAKLVGARTEEMTLTASGTALGTPHYMAPEQLEKPQEVDQRADIYSLGVVFYEMLTGELPIGKFALPSEKSTVDPRVDPIVLRALEKDRDKRFQQASEVKTRVENLGPATVPPVFSSRSSPVGPVKWCGKAVAAAVMTGLSLVPAPLCLVAVPMFLYKTASHGPARMAVGAVIVLAALALIPPAMGVTGFILGLMARREIRDSQGALRGKGLALFALWTWPVLLGLLLGFAVLGALIAVPWFTATSVRVAPTPPMVQAVSAEHPSGLTLRQSQSLAEGGRPTEVHWTLSAASGREITVTLTVLSNATPVLEKPLSAAFRTPTGGARFEGELVVKVIPVAEAAPSQVQWQARLEAGPLGSSEMEFRPPAPVAIEWKILASGEAHPLYVGMNGIYSATLLQGVQRGGLPGRPGVVVPWEVRMEIRVASAPPVP